MKTNAYPRPEIRNPNEGRNPKPERLRPASPGGRRNGASGGRFLAARFALALTLLLLAAPAPASAQSGIPAAINYQGKLTDNLGYPITSGSYTVQFRVWDHPTLTGSGDYIWGRSFPVHVVSNGLFNVLLTDNGGLVTTPATPKTTNILTAFDGSDRYLGLTIAPASTEISPRQRLATAPYAIRSWSAAIAGTLVNSSNTTVVSIVSTNVGINKTSPGTALDVAGTVTATTFSGSGSGLTLLNANNLISGTVADARLSANVAKLNAAQTFSANNTFSTRVAIGGTTAPDRPLAVQGYDWLSLKDANGTTKWHLNNLNNGVNFAESGVADARLFLRTNGNVGIGTATPGFPLSFSPSLGDKISLWGQSGNHYGLGIQNNTLQIHGDLASSKIVFGYGQSTNLTETMRIEGNGNIKVASVAPIMIRRYKSLAAGTVDGNNNTGVSTTNYSAAVVGFHSYGSFQGTGSGALIHALMRQSGGTWRIWFAVRTDNLSDIWVDVMFIRRELTDDNRGDF